VVVQDAVAVEARGQPGDDAVAVAAVQVDVVEPARVKLPVEAQGVLDELGGVVEGEQRLPEAIGVVLGEDAGRREERAGLGGGHPRLE